MTEQQEHKTVRMSEITPEILENINVGDWIEGIGDIGCYYDRKIIRIVGTWLRRFTPPNKDGVHWITGAELREIYADDLSLDKYDEIRKRPAAKVENVPLCIHNGQIDCCQTPNAEANKIAEKGNPVPSSTELIAMANLEWENREERRGIHNREDWCCGWMAGFLSEKKPNWTKEQIEAAEKRGYERALDDLGVLHGEDARKFNEELKNPSPLTPEAAEVMRKARELARK